MMNMNSIKGYGSSTMTVQELPIDTTVLQNSSNIGQALSIFKLFESILNRYCSEKDPLSKNLRLAGRSFMAYAAEKATYLRSICRTTNDEKEQKLKISEVVKETIVKIEELKMVLKNPFGTSTLIEPWLVEDTVTWDKTTLEDYQKLVAFFPRKMVSAAPHQFAQEVLDWINQWPHQIRNLALLPLEVTPAV
jgi:hypothetical protein